MDLCRGRLAISLGEWAADPIVLSVPALIEKAEIPIGNSRIMWQGTFGDEKIRDDQTWNAIWTKVRCILARMFRVVTRTQTNIVCFTL